MSHQNRYFNLPTFDDETNPKWTKKLDIDNPFRDIWAISGDPKDIRDFLKEVGTHDEIYTIDDVFYYV